jgi:hypothetical protein
MSLSRYTVRGSADVTVVIRPNRMEFVGNVGHVKGTRNVHKILVGISERK